jgi:hypothetical protein
MKRKLLYPLAVFVMIFLFHMFYSIWRASQISHQCVKIENISLLSLYFKRQDFFLSVSYALAVAFTIYAFLKFLETHRGIASVLGGITLTGILYIWGCFLLGCCGSPMIMVYFSLFGLSFLKFTKPLIFIVTIVSVVIGYLWIEKKSKICCSKNEECNRVKRR